MHANSNSHLSTRVICSLITLALCITLVELPLNSFPKAVVVFAVVTVLLATSPSNSVREWLLAIMTTVAIKLMVGIIPISTISEGHNVYLPTPRHSMATDGMPIEFRARLHDAFLKVNPTATWCDPIADLKRRRVEDLSALVPLQTAFDVHHCWLNAMHPPQLFAFAADGFNPNGSYSRQRSTLDANGASQWRIGARNDFQLTWYFWHENKNRIEFPYYVAIVLSREAVGSHFCTSQYVYWESRKTWTNVANSGCVLIDEADVGSKIWGYEVTGQQPLFMKLEQAPKLLFFEWLRFGIVLLGALLVLMWTRKFERINLTITSARAFCWVSVGVALVAIASPSFLTNLLTHIPERDPMIYSGLGRDIMIAISERRWVDALVGGESVYFFMPGLRYLRAIEGYFFGDTNLGYFVLLSLFPFLVYSLAFKVLQVRWLAIFYGVVFLPFIIRLFKLAEKGYAEPAGIFLFLSALTVLVNIAILRLDKARANHTGSIWFVGCGFTLVSLAVWVRPNMAIAAAGLSLLWLLQPTCRWRESLMICTAGSLVLLMSIHNYVFGGQWVWLTAAAALKGDTLIVAPSDYLQIFVSLLALESSSVLKVALDHLYHWLFPVRWILIAMLGIIVVHKGVLLWMRSIAIVALLTYLPFMFYRATTRDTIFPDMLATLCLFYFSLVFIRQLKAKYRAHANIHT